MESSVGRLTFSKMVHMAEGTGSMYFSNNTFVNPLTDRLMPIENGMMSRLCAVLRDMDTERRFFLFGAVSMTRRQAAFCANSRVRPGSYVGITSQKGLIDDFYFVDPLTLEYAIPLDPYGLFGEPVTIEQITSFQEYNRVIDIWKESLQKGEVMNTSQYWVTPAKTPTYVEFVYPFMELYDNGTTGIGYLALSMFTDHLQSMEMYSASETGIRVMLVEPNAKAERFIVFGNNWGQPLSNVTNVWFSTVTGQPIRFMYTDDVTDPVMREGLKYVNLRDVMGVGRKVEAQFLYSGFDARVTAKYVVTESGVELVLVVVTDRSYYMGSVLLQRDATFVGEAIALVVVTVLCAAFVEYCMVRPLRANQSKLRMALSGAPVTAANQQRIALREVRELENVCDMLRYRLDRMRAYMPDRFLAEAEGGVSHTSFRDGLDSTPLREQSSGELWRVTCSIAYVYYTPRGNPNPSDVVVGLIMQIVVCATSECGGFLEVQRPDYCVVSFGVQGRGCEIAAEASRAVEFARRLRAELTECAELDGLYRVIVESGAFLSGVISGGGRSHFVLLGRNLHHRVGGFLPLAGVVSAVTEETALLVRGRFRLLPFETVYLDASDETYVTLHEVLDGGVGTAAWEGYERCYGEAYDMMVRGDYQAALLRWDKARMVEQSSLSGEAPSCRSSQSERLRAECAARVAQGNTASYAQRSNPAEVEHDELANSDIASKGETNSIDIGSRTQSCRSDTITLHTTETLGRGDAAVSLPRHFKDNLGNTWTRSLEPVDDAAVDVTPAYMTISATGTLAVLKVYPLTEAAGRPPLAELDTALKELLNLEASDGLVQYLSYCHAPPHGVVLVMEYVPGGTLLDMKTRYGRKLPLMAVKRNVVSVLRALVFLHDRGLVHGRVCPENIMVGVEGRCRLKGMLLKAEPLLMHHDSYYVSPEEAAGATKTAAGDMYALGLLLLAMLTDTHPWQWTAQASVERSRNELDLVLADIALFRKALRDGLLEPATPPADLNDTMRVVLEACLSITPEKRLSAEAVLSTFST